jgi:O-antigen/teichoic acid export membrane protein
MNAMSFKSLRNRFESLVRVFLGKHDLSTPEGRARERQRRAGLTALASMLAKVITVATGLISVPLTLHYLGTERYGMWMTMSSAIALLSFADLGIGNGLLSSVASASGRGDRAAIVALVSSAYAVLAAIAASLAVAFALAYPFVDWAALFNVTSAEAKAEAGPATAALVACVLIAMPLGVVQRTQMGLQRGFMASLWQCFDSLVGLATVMVAIHFEAPLPYLVLGFAGAPQLANLLNSVVFFGWLQPDIAPRLGEASARLIRAIAGTGTLFLILQLVASLTYASDGLIIAQLMGADAVAGYAVPQKLFSVIGTVLAMAMAPLWPAYGEAIARGDQAWVMKTLRQSLFVSVSVATVLASILVIFGPQILHVWVGNAVSVPFSLLVGFGVWKVVEAIGLPLAMFLNGSRIIGFQILIALATGVAAFALKLILIPRFGLVSVQVATVTSFVFCSVIPIILFWNKLISRNRSHET